MSRNIVILWFVSTALAACAQSTSPDTVGGETHFLQSCDGDTACGLGLECVCGVCTKPCSSDNTCKNESTLATCKPAGTPQGACINPPISPVCDVTCAADAHCTTLGSGYTCESGSCRKLGANACVHEGTIYAASATFMVDCNACTCSDGTVTCDTQACPDGGSRRASCMIGAISHADGSTFLCSDSCNTCTCSDGIEVTLTRIACPLPSCHVIHELYWYAGSFFDIPGSGAEHTIDRAGIYTRRPLSGAPVCSEPLPGCDSSDVDATDINAALLHADVVDAVAAAPITYGTPHQDAGGAITIAGRVIRYDDLCTDDGCGVPSGIRTLVQLLNRLVQQQPCGVPGECLLPLDPGACRDSGLPRFYYDASSSTCSEFIAYCAGAGGNANNFPTEDACLANCVGVTTD